MSFLPTPGTVRVGRAALAACTVCCALTTFRCTDQVLDPMAPSWDMRLTLPLANRTHTLSELVERDTAMLRAGTGGVITYGTTVQVPPTTIGTALTVHPPDTTASVRFGPFAISAPPVSIPLTVPVLPGGAVVPVPDTTLAFSDLLQDIPTFQSVTFAEGRIILTIRNMLPVPVDVAGPVTLHDELGNTLAVFTFLTPVIPPGGSEAASEDLADRTTSHLLTLHGLVLHCAPSGVPVPIPVGPLFTLDLALSGARARRAVLAEIPAQRLLDNNAVSLQLDDSTMVSQARFSAGRLRLGIINHVALPVLLRFRFDELFRGSGQGTVYEDSVLLPAGGTGSCDLRLAGCTLRSAAGDLLSSLHAVSSVVLPADAPQPVTVSEDDRVEVHFSTPDPVVVDTAVGVIRPTWIDVNVPVAVNFGDLPTRFSGTLSIPAATLGLTTAVSFGFPVDLYLVIAARTGTPGGWTYLSVPPTQKRIPPGAGSIQFDATEVGEFFSSISGRLPDSLFLIGQVLVNPPEAYTPTPAGAGGIGRSSVIGGSVRLDVPLLLGISDGEYRDTVVIGDTTGDGVTDYAVDRARLRDIQSGTLSVDVENGLPLGVSIDVQLLDESGRLLISIPGAGETVGADPAQVNALGEVVGPARSRSSIALSAAEARQFDPARRLACRLSFSTPAGSGPVRFRLADRLRVRLWSTLIYRVNG